jgi:hypothetical protein
MRILLLSMLLWCGCGGPTLSFARTSTPPHELRPQPPEKVEIFMAAPPSRPYVELGMLESSVMFDGDNADSMPELINDMREYAGRLGCDALVILGKNDGVTTGFGKHGGASAKYKGYRGSCLVYVPALAAAPADQPTSH